MNKQTVETNKRGVLKHDDRILIRLAQSEDIGVSFRVVGGSRRNLHGMKHGQEQVVVRPDGDPRRQDLLVFFGKLSPGWDRPVIMSQTIDYTNPDHSKVGKRGFYPVVVSLIK